MTLKSTVPKFCPNYIYVENYKLNSKKFYMSIKP